MFRSGADGRYALTTLVGQNMAVVEGPAITAKGLVMANRQPVDVAPGENSIDLQVPAAPPSATPAP